MWDFENSSKPVPKERLLLGALVGVRQIPSIVEHAVALNLSRYELLIPASGAVGTLNGTAV